MSWDVNYNEDAGFIEVKYFGNVTGSDVHDAAKERIAIQEKTDIVLILTDASQTLNAPPVLDIYTITDKIYQENNVQRSTRMAFILPEKKEPRELAGFFKTTAKNRGWMIELFEDRKTALSWLKRDE